MINIAIDGPAGAGKSTLARMLAEKLEFIYADTGALYRAVGLFAVRHGINTRDADKLAQSLKAVKINMVYNDGGQRVILNGEDVTDYIRAPEISMAASEVSAVPAVRKFLLSLQKEIAAKNNIIMDGRDIGTVVLPEAQLKIFLYATPEDRAKRRYEELRQKGADVIYDNVLEDIRKRDRQDSDREVAPLKPAADAVLIDTTGFEIEQSFSRLYKLCQDALKKIV